MCMYMCMCICGHTMFVYFLFCHWNVLVSSSMNMCVCMYVCMGWGSALVQGFNRNVLTPTLPLLYVCQNKYLIICVYTCVYT